MSDDQRDGVVLRRLFHELPHHKARRLFALMHGDSVEQAGYDKEYGSTSEADAHLFYLLALGTRDRAQIERLACTSARKRDKWDTHKSYLTRTIEWALDQSVAEYEQGPVPPEGEESTALPVVRTLADFIQDPDAQRPPTAVIPRLAWTGRVTLFASSEGWGKSTLARAGAAAVTAGQAFLDGAPRPAGDVLWARLEESEYDCMISAQQFGADPNRFHVWTPGSAPVPDLIETMRELQPTLTVVDSIQELAVLAGVEKLDDAGQMGRALLDLVRAGRDLDTAMLWLSQGAKATGRYRNSSWLGHVVDAVIEIKEPKPDSAVRELVVPKRRMDVFGYRVELVQGRYRLLTGPRDVVEGEAPKLSGERKKVLRVLRAGMTWSQWAEAYGGNANTFKKEVRELRRLGVVVQDEEGGTWAPVQFEAEQELAAP